MTGRKRVPDSKVREAIASRRGNVAAAAEDLGMARKNLYSRMASLGVDPAAIRRSEPDVPIKTSLRAPLRLRLMPAHEALLRDAKFDLSARYRVDTDENALLEQFIEEAFPVWLQSKLDPRS